MEVCVICKEPENEDRLRNPNAGIKTIEEYCQLFERYDIQSALDKGTQQIIKIHASCQKKIGNEIRKKKRSDEKEEIPNRKMKCRSEH